MASLRAYKLLPVLVGVAVAVASLLVAAEPASATAALFRAKRTWWFSQAGSWTDGQVIPPTGMDGQPPAVMNVGNTTPNPAFTAPKSFIKNTTYTFMCGAGTFQCYPGYPNSSGWYSYWNAKGSFRPQNPNAPTTTTTVRVRTTMDGYDPTLMGWPTITTIVPTEMGKASRTVTVAQPSPGGTGLPITPTPGGCTGPIAVYLPPGPGECAGTTQFSGRYRYDRGGSIMIWPGGNRFGGTMRFFSGPNARFYQKITILKVTTTVTFPPVPTSQQNGTGDEFYIGTVSANPSSRGLRYQLTGMATHARRVVGNTVPSSAPCAPGSPGFGTVRPPTNAGCRYYMKTAQYIITRVPYTTGMVQAWQPIGGTNTIQTTTGADTRTPAGLNGNISMVHPRLIHSYVTARSLDPDAEILMVWASARTRKIEFRMLPEPAGVAMLAAGFATLAGLYRLRRR